jgi:hypothetical protein
MLIHVKESHKFDGRDFPGSYFPNALGGVLDLLDSSIFTPGYLSHPTRAAFQLEMLDKTLKTLALATKRANAIADSVLSLSAREDFTCLAEQELACLRRTIENLSTECAACNCSEQ